MKTKQKACKISQLKKSDDINNLDLPQLKSGGNTGIILGAIIVVIVVCIAWLALNKIEQQTQADLKDKLETVLNITHNSIDNWIKHRTDDAIGWTANSNLIQHIKGQLHLPRTKKMLTGSMELDQMRNVLKPLLADHKDLGFFLISPDYVNMASMRDENIGEVNLLANYGDYLNKIFRGQPQCVLPCRPEVVLPRVPGELSKNGPIMFIGVPIYDNGKVIAAFTVCMDPSLEFTRITHIARTGETGDTYAFNKDGLLITECRFNDHIRQIGLIGKQERGILLLSIRDPGGNMLEGFTPTVERENQPLTRMAKSAISGESGFDVDGYRDYRGVPVVGAWLWDNVHNNGLTFEIDVTEAYKSFYYTRVIVIIVFSVTIALLFGLSISLVKRNKLLYVEITERKQAEDLLKIRESQQREISEIGKFALTSQTELTVLMDRIVYCIAKILDVEYCKILELLPDGEKMLLVAGIGWKEGCVGKVAVGTDRGSQAGYTLLSDNPVIVNDLRTETRFNGPKLLHDHGVVSGISTIIYGMDLPYGVLGVHTKKKRVFTKDDVSFVQSIANILAEAIKRKKAEGQIKASLNEKETLLQEIHHRVKNNMQVISSLIKSQSENIEEKRYVEMFRECQNRIRTMSLIHEKLYHSEDLSRIKLKDYIRSLVNEIFRSYRKNTARIKLRMDIEDISIGIDSSIPCGLVVNELVSNSLKYAFPEDREGEIKISLHRIADLKSEIRNQKSEMFELVFSDNGVGIPEDLDYRNSKSLGLRLIVNLTEHQLDGKVELDRSKGTEFRIRFKEIKYKKRM